MTCKTSLCDAEFIKEQNDIFISLTQKPKPKLHKIFEKYDQSQQHPRNNNSVFDRKNWLIKIVENK